MSPHWAIVSLAWLGAWALAAAVLGIAYAVFRHHTAPAPADTRVPGPAPVPGGAASPSAPPSGPGCPPVRPAPAPGLPEPGEHFTHGRRLLTVRFYEDGAACVWDATGWHVATFGSGADRGWDEWLKRITDGQR